MNRLQASRPALSIVLPCYNPKSGWHFQVANNFLELKKSLPPDLIVELIVVNDGSPKPINQGAKKYLQRRFAQFRFISYKTNMGKGYAVRKGVEAAQAPYVIYTDIDFPYTTADICAVYDTLVNDQAELVMGKREAVYQQQLSPLRKLASGGCNYLNKTLLNLPHTDVQSGLKGMNLIGRELLLRTTINRFLFDTEFVWLAGTYRDVRIKALPVRLREGISFTSMSSSVYLNEAGNFCKLLLRDKLQLLRRLDGRFKTALPRPA